MTISTILARIDPNLEDAAYSLGASSSEVFRTVTLPLAAPGIANAFLLVFSCSLADFATPQVLGGHSFPVLPTQAYLQITGMYDFKGGAALSFMLLIPALVVYALQHYWVSKKSYVTVSGKAGGKSSIKGPGIALTSLMASIVAVVVAFIIAIYAVILVGSLVKVWGVNNTITFDNYNYVFTHGMKAIKDTLIIACIGTPLGGLLAVLVGYVTTRLKIRGHKTLETVSLLNYTLPGTVVGIAYIIAFNDKPIVLTGTVYILIAAYLFRYSSAGIRNVIAALTQIDPSIEEASRSPWCRIDSHLHIDYDPACAAGNPCRYEVPFHSLHDGNQRNDFPRFSELDADHNAYFGMHDRTSVRSSLRLLCHLDFARLRGLRHDDAAC